jgi:hypothetical protein
VLRRDWLLTSVAINAAVLTGDPNTLSRRRGWRPTVSTSVKSCRVPGRFPFMKLAFLLFVACAGYALLLTSALEAQRRVPLLTDATCRSEVLAVSVPSMNIHARCEAAGAERVMHLSVTNWAAPDAGPLRAFSIGFCGQSVISAAAPSGWLVKIENRDE